MAFKIALVGSELDPTHYGGGVITKGSSTNTYNGIPIARVGDEAVCKKHGKTKIAEGSAIFKVDGGIPVAYVGCKTECGAEIKVSIAEATVSS